MLKSLQSATYIVNIFTINLAAIRMKWITVLCSSYKKLFEIQSSKYEQANVKK